MAIKVKAVERNVSFDKNSEKWAYVLQADLYNKLSQSKVINEAALRSGIAKGAINAAWDAIGEVIKAWATEGHSVAVPGLGTMRFGLRSKSIADVNKVGSDLITTRRVIFTPNMEIKDELKKTSINITCYDRNGEVVKRVTSTDDGEVEDPEDDNPGGDTPNGGGNSGSGSTDQGSSTGEATGGSSAGNNTGNGGSGSGSGSVTPSAPKLTISRSGNGTSSVSANGNAVSSGSELTAGTEVSISVTPAEGTVPTASLNGSSVTLTESDGVYTGTFQMPSSNATLAINSGGTTGGGSGDMN